MPPRSTPPPGKVNGKYKMGKHFEVNNGTSLAVTRRQPQIDAEAAIDGICVIRTPVPESELDAAGVVTACQNL